MSRRKKENPLTIKEGLEKLPCGLKIDLLKNQCCMTICPDPNKRGNSEAIEKCEHWKKKQK